MKKILHPSYLTDIVGERKIAFHPLVRHILDNPPQGYEFFDEAVLGQQLNIRPYTDDIAKRAQALGVPDAAIGECLRFRYNPWLHEAPVGYPTWVTTFAVYLGPNPWMVEIEDIYTLMTSRNIGNSYFNGWEHDILGNKDVWFARAHLETDQCRGVVTHIRSTLDQIERVFGDHVRDKSFYMPVACENHGEPKKVENGRVKILFHGSSNHTERHFMYRGGVELVRAFVAMDCPNLELTVVYDVAGMHEVPNDVRDALFTHPHINYIGDYLPPNDLQFLRTTHHVLAIPAYRVHSMSIAQGMMAGMCILGSNGWGFNEYVTHEHNGFVAEGEEYAGLGIDGIMRESYDPRRERRGIKHNIMSILGHMSDNPHLVYQTGRNARTYALRHHSTPVQQKCLKKIFDARFA